MIIDKYSVQPSNNAYNYILVLLMIGSAILGSTIFDTVQILVEMLLFVLLGYGLFTVKLKISDIALLTVFVITFIVSFFLGNFLEIALNFKIYGLCILTFVYFRKVHLVPTRLINFVHVINICLIIHQFITGHFIVPSAWFFGQYQEYANSRPVGIFLTPHASSFFIAVCSLHIILAKRKYFKGSLFFLLNLTTGSFTSLIAFMAQLAIQPLNHLLRRIPVFRFYFWWSAKLLIIGIPLLLLASFKDQFIEVLKANPYSRYYSVEIILNQIFDSRFFSDIFKFYSRNYQEYSVGQENIFADYANEIGFVKVFVEAGFVLGVFVIFSLISNLKYYGIFIFVSLLHYSFAINMPFMLFLMIQYNRELILKQTR